MGKSNNQTKKPDALISMLTFEERRNRFNQEFKALMEKYDVDLVMQEIPPRYQLAIKDLKAPKTDLLVPKTGIVTTKEALEEASAQPKP